MPLPRAISTTPAKVRPRVPATLAVSGGQAAATDDPLGNKDLAATRLAHSDHTQLPDQQSAHRAGVRQLGRDPAGGQRASDVGRSRRAGVGARSWEALLGTAAVAVTLMWLQTTAEEWLFRGYVVQWLSLSTGRPLVLAAVSGALFALPHLANPEVLTLSGLALLLGPVPYFVFGCPSAG